MLCWQEHWLTPAAAAAGASLWLHIHIYRVQNFIQPVLSAACRTKRLPRPNVFPLSRTLPLSLFLSLWLSMVDVIISLAQACTLLLPLHIPSHVTLQYVFLLILYSLMSRANAYILVRVVCAYANSGGGVFGSDALRGEHLPKHSCGARNIYRFYFFG